MLATDLKYPRVRCWERWRRLFLIRLTENVILVFKNVFIIIILDDETLLKWNLEIEQQNRTIILSNNPNFVFFSRQIELLYNLSMYPLAT